MWQEMERVSKNFGHYFIIYATSANMLKKIGKKRIDIKKKQLKTKQKQKRDVSLKKDKNRKCID